MNRFSRALGDEGDWTVRASVYRDGKLVGWMDVRSPSYRDLGYEFLCAVNEADVTPCARFKEKP